MRRGLVGITLIAYCSVINLNANDSYGLVNMDKLKNHLNSLNKRISILESVVFKNKVVESPKDIIEGDGVSREVMNDDIIIKIDANTEQIIKQIIVKEKND